MMRRNVAASEYRGDAAVFEYHCVQCSAVCASYHKDLVVDRYIPLDTEMPKQVRGTGLGTWRCPTHGKTKVRRLSR